MSGAQRPDALSGSRDLADVTLTIASDADYSAKIPLVRAGNDLALFQSNGAILGLLMRMNHNSLIIYKMDQDQNSASSKEYTIVWEPSSFTGPPSQATTWGGAGAVWSFRNRVFAACNDGPMYKVDTTNFDYDDALVTQITVHYLGESVSTSINDGANCLHAKDPWQECPDNSDAPGTDVADCKCNAGYTGPDGGSGVCTECAAGKFKSIVGSASCDVCPGANRTGSTVCTTCPSGKTWLPEHA